jgi:hypothetical protein
MRRTAPRDLSSAARSSARSGARVSPAFACLALEITAVAHLATLLVSMKLDYTPPLGDGLDGAYYLHIARHVALGHGFVTSFSTFHHGLEPLPQPAMTYPLWPLLLGLVGRASELEAAALWLPRALYLSSLALAYFWLRSTVRRSFPHARRFAPVLALSTTALLGVNPIFHWATSRPYTEGLGMSLVLVTLIAHARATVRRARSKTHEAALLGAVGCLASACYFARFQLLVVGVALVLVELARGRHAFRRALWLLVGFATPLLFWAVRFLRMPHAELRALFDYAVYRQLPSLPPFEYTRPCGSTLDCALDKLGGLLEAFSLRSPDSYVVQFGGVVYALPLGLVVLAVSTRARAALRHAFGRARHVPLFVAALAGVLAVLPIHFVHSLHWRAWAFGWRQGLPLLLALWPVLLLLLTRGAPRRGGADGVERAWWRGRRVSLGLKLVTGAALAHSLVTLGAKSWHLADADPIEADLDAARAAARYLERVAPSARTLGIEPQPVAAFTTAPLDWLACWSPPELAETLVRERHATRALLRAGELRCRSFDRIRPRLSLEAVIGHSYGVFRVGAERPADAAE